jgi:hypothetical protein
VELKVEAEGVLIRSVHPRLSLVDRLQVYRPMDSESGHKEGSVSPQMTAGRD